MGNLNLLPVTTNQIVIVAKTGNDANTGLISALPEVLATDAKLTVQAAVTACAAGGTVLIYPGTYNEGVVASTAINLLGTNKDACIIDSDAIAERAFSPSGGSGQEVENLTFKSETNSTTYTLGTAGYSNFIARHVNINHYAAAATYAFVSYVGSINTLLDDAYITSTTGSGNGVNLLGSYDRVMNSTIACSVNTTGVGPIGLINTGLQSRVTNTNIYATNSHAGSAGTTGIKNSSDSVGTLFVEKCFAQSWNASASSTTDAVAVLAEKEMIIKDSELMAISAGSGNAYGLKVSANMHVLLINCKITSTSGTGTAYSISADTGAKVTCVNCDLDWSATTGAGTIVAGGVDVLTGNGLALIGTADMNAAVDDALNTAIPGSPTADSINQRIKAIDDLTQAGGAGDLETIKRQFRGRF